MRKLFWVGILTCICNGFSLQAQNTAPLTATVHTERMGQPIHPYVYGMFTELLSNMFENGIWAEMLSDRKFFYAVDNSAELIPRNSKRHQNRWRPVGAEQNIVMDANNAYVGKHSPKIILDGTNRIGIKQANMWLRKGNSYTGRIVLSGEPGLKVEVSLVWGTSPNSRQTISLDHLSKEYKKFPLFFTVTDDTNDGYIEITSTGKGSFGIGAVSIMPSNNIHGFRRDIIDVLSQLNSGIYRWPGGNFLANYDWRHGIGDPDQRPPRYDYAWNTVESNDVGTDEFMDMCNLIGVDPYICVNSGLGDAYSAAQWVEYVNGKKDTEMGKWRTQNGHPEPYHVKHWGIGNEMYGEWQLGHMSSEHYSLKHNFFAEAMREKDPSIKLVASGATIFEASTTARHHRMPLHAPLPYEYLTLDDWSGTLLKGSLENIDYLAEHVYPVFNGHFDGASQKWVQMPDSFPERMRRTPNRIKGMIESVIEYEKRIPGLKEKHITCWIDEWVGGERGGFEVTLGSAAGLNEIFRHSEYITMGAYTGFTSLFSSNDVAASISSKGLLFKLYREHVGEIPLELSGNSPQKPVIGTVGVDIPAEVSGSPTYPLDVLATINKDKTKLSIVLVNPMDTEQELKVSFDGKKIGGNAKIWTIATTNLRTENRPDEPPVISLKEQDAKWNPAIKVLPYSVTVYELDIVK